MAVARPSLNRGPLGHGNINLAAATLAATLSHDTVGILTACVNITGDINGDVPGRAGHGNSKDTPGLSRSTLSEDTVSHITACGNVPGLLDSDVARVAHATGVAGKIGP